MAHKMVLVVRKDLGMSIGKTAAQCSHAAVTLTAAGLITDPRTLRQMQIWFLTGQTKVALKAESQEQLEQLADACTKAGINNCIIRDAGRTELVPGTSTVLGIGPADEEEIDAITGKLKLL